MKISAKSSASFPLGQVRELDHPIRRVTTVVLLGIRLRFYESRLRIQNHDHVYSGIPEGRTRKAFLLIRLSDRASALSLSTNPFE